MPTTLIVGASRGIGQSLVQLFRQDGHSVIATVRDTSKVANEDGIKYIQLDITDEESIKKAASEVDAIDNLVVVAAIGSADRILSTSPTRLTEYLDANVVGPHRVILAFLDALKKGEKKNIILISSQSGSLTRQVNASRGFMGPYAVTKAAVNMLAVQLHNELKSDGFKVIPLHPGWVATDMGKQAGDGGMPVEKSAAGIVKVVNELDESKSAHFYDFSGQELPW